MTKKAEEKFKRDLENKPYVSNYPPLQNFLVKHGAHCMWQLQHGDEDEDYGVRAYVEAWIFPKTNRIAIIQIHANKMGWEIYTPANTLADTAKRLGL